MSTARTLSQEIRKLTVEAQRVARRTCLVHVLELPEPHPAGAVTLTPERCALFVGGPAALHRSTLDVLRAHVGPPEEAPVPDGVTVIPYSPTRARFFAAVLTGNTEDERPAIESDLIGGRGSRKTHTALGVLTGYAAVHAAAGGALPARVMILGGTGVQLRATVGRSMLAEWWRGGWSLSDDGHRALFVLDGVTWLDCDLVGVEDQAQGADRLRRECHLLYGDEPAPAVADQNAGFSDSAWLIALSSRRLPTPLGHRPAVLASNAPSPRHWTWRRYVTAPPPGCVAFRIPPEEAIPADQLAELQRALADRPDLLARLMAGEAAEALLGAPVAAGYLPSFHVSPAGLRPHEGQPVWLGWDGGLSPSCVVLQVLDGRVLVYAGLTQRGGTEQLIEGVVKPWLSAHVPWVMRSRAVQHAIDPSMAARSQDNSDHSPELTLWRLLPGRVVHGAVDWPTRRDPLLTWLARADGRGRGALQIAPGGDTEELRQALAGGWYYPVHVGGDVRSEQPKKPNAPAADLGDALLYALGAATGAVDREARREQQRRRDPLPRSKGDFNLRDYSDSFGGRRRD